MESRLQVSSLTYNQFHGIYGPNVSQEAYNNFYTPLDQTRGLLIAAYCILFLIGACGNSWVACVITFVMRRSHNSDAPRSVQIFILALCCCDLLVLIFLTFLIADLVYGRWFGGPSWLCLLYLSSESINKFCSPFILIALSCLCYLSICQNGASRLSNSNIRTPLLVVFCCAIVMLVLVTPVFIYGDVHYVVFENQTDNQTYSLWAVMQKCAFYPPEAVLKAFTMYTFVFGYIVPAALFTYFYSSVLLYVRRHAKHCAVNSLHFWRVAKTTMSLVCFYLVCWTPYWSLNMYEYLRPLFVTEEEQSEPDDGAVVVGYFIHMLPYVNCCGYPILYTLLNRNITQAYDNVKNARISKKKRRRMASEACSQSRVATQQLTSAVVMHSTTPSKYSTTPSPTKSFISYLTTPSSRTSSPKIKTSLTAEMVSLSPSTGHKKSASANAAINYGAIV